jgi:hypothetical protein
MFGETKINKNSPPHVRENNRVVIRVWTSSLNHRVPGQDVGHVSIETADNYISLWPSELVSIKGPGVFTPVKPQYHHYVDDLRDEKRRAERTICLYSLYIPELIAEFEKIKEIVKEEKLERNDETGETEQVKNDAITGWRLIGSNVLSRLNNSGGESCASLAYRLLNAGRIYDLVSSKYSSKYSSIVTPDALLLAIEDARKEELYRYPAVKDYAYSNPRDLTEQEWIPDTIQGRHKIECIIL